MSMTEKAEKALKLYDIVEKFIEEQNIWSDECVYQSDRVIENAYAFIAELCDIVGYKPLEDEDD
jgi:glutaminase